MLRRRARDRKWASIFAEDLLRGCSDLFTVFGGDVLNLPISIPIDEQGVVLLQPRGPLEAPRVPATMTVTRPQRDAYGVNIRRVDGGSMIVPGLGDSALTELTLLLTIEGLEIGPGELPLDEYAARALANALLITIEMKLTKARHGEGMTPAP